MVKTVEYNGSVASNWRPVAEKIVLDYTLLQPNWQQPSMLCKQALPVIA
jgi:hypothetical protein